MPGDPSVCNEFLYGRVGFLYSLLLLRTHFTNPQANLLSTTLPADLLAQLDAAIEALYGAVLDAGRLGAQAFAEQVAAQRNGRKGPLPVQLTHAPLPPLMYEWHGTKYLGAAHGICGILEVLMQVARPELLNNAFRFAPATTTATSSSASGSASSASASASGGVRQRDREEDLQQLIRPTVEYLLRCRYESGNFLSSIEGAGTDKLVHWCHGAPGAIYMLLTAYRVCSVYECALRVLYSLQFTILPLEYTHTCNLLLLVNVLSPLRVHRMIVQNSVLHSYIHVCIICILLSY